MTSLPPLGSSVEVLLDDGWVTATLTGTAPEDSSMALITLSAPAGDDGPQSQVPADKVRPPPPAPPEDYLASLDTDAIVEALTESNRWQPATFLACKMLRSEGGGRKCQCTVRFISTEVEALVDEQGVRPFLAYSDGSWAPAPSPPTAATGSALATASTNRPDGGDPMAIDGAATEVSATAGAAAANEPQVLHPVSEGATMEVTSREQGLIGSWYEVKILRLGTEADAASGGDPGHFLVHYTGTDESGNDDEWVEQSRLRPLPPASPTVPTPVTWTRRLQSGDTIELQYEQGWWEVQFLSRSGSTLRVLATLYGKVHEVTASSLRPGWRCKEGGVWEYALGGVTRTAEEWAAQIATNPARVKGGAHRASAGAAAPRPRRENGNDPLQQLATSSGFVGAGSPGAAGSEAAEPGEIGSFKWGVAVEVRSEEEHLKGCWCPAEVLRVLDNDTKVHISWVADTDPPNATAEVERARPAAPAPPPGWAANLRPGEPVDVFHDGAWWAVVLESRKGVKAKVVDAPNDPLPREVKLSALRPRYEWLGWEGGWKFATDGRDYFVPQGPAPLTHNMPSTVEAAGASAGQTSKGRTIKPKGGGGSAAADAAAASLVPLVDPERVPKVGQLLEVEVAEAEDAGGSVDWKPAEVVSVLPRQRFIAMVNGEEDFMEEYGMEDEGKEWRKVAPEDLDRVAKANDEAKAADKEARRLQDEKDLAEAAALVASGAKAGDDATKAKGKRKSTEGASKAPSAAQAYRFKFGMEVEVRVRDKGFEGSWYAAEVLSSKEDGCCVVQFDALYEAPAAGQPVTSPCQDTVKGDALRPKPPATPQDWAEKLSPGTPMELSHEDGWWQVTYVSRLVGTDSILVKSMFWGSQHLVQLSSLRPGWRWSPGLDEWSIKGAASSSGSSKAGGSASRGAGKTMGRGRGQGRGRGRS